MKKISAILVAVLFILALAGVSYTISSCSSTTDETADDDTGANDTANDTDDTDDTDDADDDAGGTFTLTSDDLPSSQEIASTYVLTDCSGSNSSPQLAWTNVPADAESLAVTVLDLDCTGACSGDSNAFIHWIVYNIPTTTLELERGASEDLPTGAANGGNDFDDPTIPNYGGPCPLAAHTYEFKVWALDTADLTDDTTITFTDPDSILDGIEDHAITSGTSSIQREFTP